MSDEHTLTVHQMAADTIRDMNAQAQAQYEAWKHVDTEIAPKALASLSRQISELFSMFFGDNTHIARDGDLSLYVSTPSIVFGVIFHPDHYRVDTPHEGDVSTGVTAKRMGRYCLTSKGNGAYCGKPFTKGEATCECTEHIVMLLPVPGTWSFHS